MSLCSNIDPIYAYFILKSDVNPVTLELATISDYLSQLVRLKTTGLTIPQTYVIYFVPAYKLAAKMISGIKCPAL